MPETTIQPYRGSSAMPSFDHATVVDAMHPETLLPIGILSTLDIAGVVA